MSQNPDQIPDSASTVPMSDDKSGLPSPTLPAGSGTFSSPSSPGSGQQYSYNPYPLPPYVPYPYPPPSYTQPGNTVQNAQAYPVYKYPLPLRTSIKQLPRQYLRVLIRPSVATFEEEKQKAAWNIVWVQLVLNAVIGGLFGFAIYTYLLPTFFAQFQITKISIFDVKSLYEGMAVRGTLNGFFSTPIYAFIDWSVLYFVAKAFKGRGRFLEYIYCSTLFFVPLQFLSDLLSFIPVVGLFLTPAVIVYAIIITISMTRAVHRLSTIRASLAVLIIPTCAFLFLLVVATLVFLAAALIVSGH